MDFVGVIVFVLVFVGFCRTKGGDVCYYSRKYGPWSKNEPNCGN